MSKTTVIYHSADFDGLFCEQIARRFLGTENVEYIGWNHGDKTLEIPNGAIYVMDLPVDRVFGFAYSKDDTDRPGPKHPPGLVWIDHHKSSIETHPTEIEGYRIDGVAACRLAWQWFTFIAAGGNKPIKDHYTNRLVNEPLAVRLAGEYDIWDKRDPRAELFQHGLRSQNLDPNCWRWMLGTDCDLSMMESSVDGLLRQGMGIQYARTQENASIIQDIGFTLQWEGLTFLCCNAARYNSHLFTAGLKPEHDACFGFKWTGKTWSVSLYHAPGKEHHDLSEIAKKYGGGGHRGACGFQADKLPFIP